MTNDYKTTLLEYLTGNLEEETGINIPQFSQTIITETNLYDELMTLMPKGFQQKGYLRCKDNNGDFDALWDINLNPLLNEYLRGFRKADNILEYLKNIYDGVNVDDDNEN
jgi:hypothetical protein